MLLRNTFSNTKKFFSKTFQNFKSLVSGGGYQKLPKTPSFNYDDHHQHQYLQSHHQSSKEFDNFYTELSNKWEGQSADHGHHQDPIKKQNKKKSTLIMDHHHDEEDVCNGRSFIKFSNPNTSRTVDDHIEKKKQKSTGRDHQRDNINEEENKRMREVTSRLVKQNMRELVMIDMKNKEHVMDVEEMIHYYSRLTCPVYLDIIDRFFTELYYESFQIYPSSSSTNNIISHHHY